MKPLQKIRRLFRGRKENTARTTPVEPVAPIETPDEEPEWKKKIAIINARCELRKTEMRMLQGGRMITLDDEPERRTAKHGHSVR